MEDFLAHWQIFRPLIRMSFQVLHFLKNLKGNLHENLSLYRINIFILLSLTAMTYNSILFQTWLELLQKARPWMAAEWMDFPSVAGTERTRGRACLSWEGESHGLQLKTPRDWGWRHLPLATNFFPHSFLRLGITAALTNKDADPVSTKEGLCDEWRQVPQLKQRGWKALSWCVSGAVARIDGVVASF